MKPLRPTARSDPGDEDTTSAGLSGRVDERRGVEDNKVWFQAADGCYYVASYTSVGGGSIDQEQLRRVASGMIAEKYASGEWPLPPSLYETGDSERPDGRPAR